ncbi:FKBP-type peptidyl-prolyl cis-trans isomerase N-terminal domain-containing protein [Klebsiella huaxiensis]|uniref:Cell envelope biogenesis protein TolA n=1 Tax=Klebsiella huaxiensis TaxID=2153354 RepID=A0ABT6EHJ5_9ENTR|nr:FKBP-type peptidyl-prolyl cis-trans isomerase N-terminal domain-containing protein [Klebsiella huaxiensis]MDG1644878.1 cell envelope biogenesis protein TolA [Klebsiella huaxiensis]
MPLKQETARKKINQNNKTEASINALKKQNAELSAAAKAAEKKRDETTRELSAQIAVLKAQIGPQDSAQKTSLDALTKKNAELTAAVEAAQKKLDDTTRTLSVQIAALKTQSALRAQNAQSENGQKNTISALTKKNAELSVVADAAQKKLDETTRTLSAQINALKTQNSQGESQQKVALEALTKKNAELTAAAEAAQKKLDETTRTLSAQIAALKTQNSQGESQQKVALVALTKKNAELTAAAEAAQKKLDETTRTLSAQIAALKTQNSQGESQQKVALEALTKKNAELTAAAEAAQKKLDETTHTLSAQIAALKTQNSQGESQQKVALEALTKKNAELTAAAEAAQKTRDNTTHLLSAQITAADTAQKKYDASIFALNEKNKKLQSTLDSLSIKEKVINLADKSNKNAYALGVFYLTQALSDVNKMADNDVKLTPSALVSGFNDAYNKKIKIKEDEIETIVNTLNDQMSSRYVDIEKRIMAKIKGKKYEILPNGVYFVIEKKGKVQYKVNESLSMNILEKKLDGTPILNTMNSTFVNNKDIDPLIGKVLSSGLKGGIVTLYGQAGSLYSTPPTEINPDTLISITFELQP